MTLPKRWLEDPELCELERSVLQSGLSGPPPALAREQVWAGLLAALPSPAGPGVPVSDGAPTPTSVAASASGSSSAVAVAVLKGLLLGAVVGAAAMGVSQLTKKTKPALSAAPSVQMARVSPAKGSARAARESDELAQPVTSSVPGPDSSAPRLVGSAARAPMPVVPVFESSPQGAASVATFPVLEPEPGASAPAGQSAVTRSSRLKVEAALLRAAREQLRAGHLASAANMLATADREFPEATLSQEREALSIELLSQSGQKALAVQRAEEFLRRYPESPHAARVRELLAP